LRLYQQKKIASRQVHGTVAYPSTLAPTNKRREGRSLHAMQNLPLLPALCSLFLPHPPSSRQLLRMCAGRHHRTAAAAAAKVAISNSRPLTLCFFAH